MQVNRSYEPRQPVFVTKPEDVAFVAELNQLVKDWLAGRPVGDSNLVHLTQGGQTTDDEGGTGAVTADEDAAAATPAVAGAAAAADGGVQAPLDQLVLAPLNSYKRLLAFQELEKPQSDVEGHPGFWVTKVCVCVCVWNARLTAVVAGGMGCRLRVWYACCVEQRCGGVNAVLLGWWDLGG